MFCFIPGKFEPGVFSKWCDPDLEYRWLRQEEDARKSNNETFLRWKEAERLEAERKRLKAERKRLKEEETCRRSERLEARRQSELLKENLGGEDRTVEPVKMEKEKEKESKSASRTCTPEEKGALRLVLDKIKSKETKKGMQLSRGEIVRLIERMIRK